MNAASLSIVAVFSSMQSGRDLHFDGEVVWSASSGGIEIFDTDGRSIAAVRDLPSRDTTAIGWFDGLLTVGTTDGGYRWMQGAWQRVGSAQHVVAVTELGMVFRDGSSWPDDGFRGFTVEAVAWKGELVRFTNDGLMHTADRIVELPGPVADAKVVGGEIRIALHGIAAIWDAHSLRVLPIPATAAGPWWGTSEGAIVTDRAERIGGVPGLIHSIESVDGVPVVGTDTGVWSVGRQTKAWSADEICDNFITGITRHAGELVVSTFNGGACAFDGELWRSLTLPTTMANDVLSDGETLWVATSDGLVEVGKGVHRRASEEDRPGDAGVNHNGVNALSMSRHGLWAVDVLGPVSVSEWVRHRWSVLGRSHPSIAACPSGEVWVGSEDAGLAVRGADVGRRNGRSMWRQFGRLDGLPENWIMAVECAGPGAAWVGTYRNGVGRVDASGWTPLLVNAWVQSLLADDDVLWVGTADGLYRSDASGVVRVLNEDVHALFREEDVLWVGTRSGLVGLSV